MIYLMRVHSSSSRTHQSFERSLHLSLINLPLYPSRQLPPGGASRRPNLRLPAPRLTDDGEVSPPVTHGWLLGVSLDVALSSLCHGPDARSSFVASMSLVRQGENLAAERFPVGFETNSDFLDLVRSERK